MDAHSLLLFVAAGLLLNLTPGPDVLYIVTNALRGGRRAGVVAACGITAGCFVLLVLSGTDIQFHGFIGGIEDGWATAIDRRSSSLPAGVH